MDAQYDDDSSAGSAAESVDDVDPDSPVARRRPMDPGRILSCVKRLPRESAIVHETASFDTADHEDHTFSGIMFDVTCGDKLPMKYCRIDSVWVRGCLGLMRIFITKQATGFQTTFEGGVCEPEYWEQIYEKFHDPHLRAGADGEKYSELKLTEPVIVNPGERYGLYVHSGREDDEGIVYDDSRHHMQQVSDEGTLTVQPRGYAHLNPEPFNSNSPWGYGRGWRQNREFVGKLSFGVKWLLWSPEDNTGFPAQFKEIVELLLLCWNRESCVVSWLPQEMLFYIMNKVRWDSFGRPAIAEPEPEPEEDRLPDGRRQYQGGGNAAFFYQFLHGLHNGIFWEHGAADGDGDGDDDSSGDDELEYEEGSGDESDGDASDDDGQAGELEHGGGATGNGPADADVTNTEVDEEDDAAMSQDSDQDAGQCTAAGPEEVN